MGLLERSIYPRIRSDFTAKELHDLYSPSEDEILFARSSVRGDSSLLNFLAMLKTFQQLHYFPAPTRLPLAISRHIHTCLKLTSIRYTAYPPASLYRHQKTIREYLGISPYDHKARHLAVRTVLEAARTRDDLVDLINVAVETLIYNHYELPAFDTLERIVRRARHWMNTSFYGRVLDSLNKEAQSDLEKILLADPLKRVSLFNRLKEPPQNATLTHLREWQKHLEWLESLGPVEKWLAEAELPLVKQQQFALQAKTTSVGDLKACLPAKRYSLLICLIQHSRVSCRDNLVEMFLRRMGAMHKSAKVELELMREAQRGLSENLITAFSEVLELVGSNPSKLKSVSPTDHHNEGEDDYEEEDELEDDVAPLSWSIQS